MGTHIIVRFIIRSSKANLTSVAVLLPKAKSSNNSFLYLHYIIFDKKWQ